MSRSVEGIRMWINGAEPERGRTLEHANEEVRTLLGALDAERERTRAKVLAAREFEAAQVIQFFKENIARQFGDDYETFFETLFEQAENGEFSGGGDERVDPVATAREVCICAAIRLPDGRVFRGHRHGDCIRSAKASVDHMSGFDGPEWHPSMAGDQGFMTSRNRYVDRVEGQQLQLAAGIESACPSGYRANVLFSEDLY